MAEFFSQQKAAVMGETGQNFPFCATFKGPGSPPMTKMFLTCRKQKGSAAKLQGLGLPVEF